MKKQIITVLAITAMLLLIAITAVVYNTGEIAPTTHQRIIATTPQPLTSHKDELHPSMDAKERALKAKALIEQRKKELEKKQKAKALREAQERKRKLDEAKRKALLKQKEEQIKKQTLLKEKDNDDPSRATNNPSSASPTPPNSVSHRSRVDSNPTTRPPKANHRQASPQIKPPSGAPANSITLPQFKVTKTINERYGYVNKGKLTLPNNVDFIRYQYGARLQDSKGTVTIAQHVTWNDLTGVMSRLRELKPGAIIYSTDANRKVKSWKLERIILTDKYELPREIFTRKGHSKLVMITCGGEITYTSRGRIYHSNVIAHFNPVN